MRLLVSFLLFAAVTSVAHAQQRAPFDTAYPLRPPARHAAVRLGARRIPLDADLAQFPAGKAYRDRTHEGANFICTSYPAAARAPFLVIYDEDLGLPSAALVLPGAGPYRECPAQQGTVRLEYRGRLYDLATPPGEIRNRYGRPQAQEGDTLTWWVRWQNPTIDPKDPTLIFFGSTWLRIVQRAGRLVYIEVGWLETT
jgi:hypothetical protein